jgi:hypothetical protein
VIGPWARRHHVSHVNYSFQSVFATIERILGVPAMGRPDASASPMWDMFATLPDEGPYTVREKRIAAELNDSSTPGAEASLRMDFRGPDRNPELGVVLDAYRQWRMGRITREEAEARIDRLERSLPAGVRRTEEELAEAALEREEEAREETFAFDRAYRQYAAWLSARGEPVPVLRGGPKSEAEIRRIMGARYRGPGRFAAGVRR